MWIISGSYKWDDSEKVGFLTFSGLETWGFRRGEGRCVIVHDFIVCGGISVGVFLQLGLFLSTLLS
jgi:hypothetical protein